MADVTPQNKMLGTATGLAGCEVMLLRRAPDTMDSIHTGNFFGPNSDQAAPGNHTHTLATTSAPGFMTTAQVAKLTALNTSAQIPAGGTAGQIIAKVSTTDYNIAWVNPPTGTSGGGWAQYGTAATLAVANVTMVVGTSGYETDTNRWKLADGFTAWNSLAYTDTPKSPSVINNPGTSVTFSLRPEATQLITYSTHPGGTVTIGAPTGAPPSGYEAEMFLRVTNSTATNIIIAMPAFNLIGDSFADTVTPSETMEYAIQTLGGIWYVFGETDIASGSVTNAHLDDMLTGTIKARITASTGAPQDATATQIRALVDAAQPSVVSLAANTTMTKAAHQGKTIVCTAAVTLTVNATTDFDQHASCLIKAEGGAVTITNTATVNVTGTGRIIPQHAIGMLSRSTAADVYSLQWVTATPLPAVVSPEANNLFTGPIWAGLEINAGTTDGTLYLIIG